MSKKQGIQTPAELTGTEVIQIFSARAGGATVDAIAKQFNMASGSVSRVLHRQYHPDVPIPPKILAKVEEKYGTGAGKARAPKTRKAKSKLPPMTVSGALAAYMSACVQLRRARKECLNLGVKAEALDLLLKTEQETRAAQ